MAEKQEKESITNNNLPLTRTELRFLVVREDDPTIMAFALEDLIKRGYVKETNDKLIVSHERLEDDMPVYDRIVLRALGMEWSKLDNISDLVESFRDVEAAFFSTLRDRVKGYFDFRAEAMINLVSALVWLFVIVGWTPFLLIRGSVWFSRIMWFWIFGMPIIAGIITLLKPPLTPEGREIVEKYADTSIKKWKPESDFVKRLARGLKQKNLWPEHLAAKGTGKNKRSIAKWF